jgi:hypothetical protein
MSVRAIVATIGVVLVTAYAALMAVDALVLYPLAAVPGHSLSQIYDGLARADMNVALDITADLVMAGIGVVLAILAITIGLRGGITAPALASTLLGILAAGAIPAWYSGVFLGMDIADTFAPGDDAQTVWPHVLFVTSLAALVAVPVTAIITARRRRVRAVAA